MSMPRTKRPFAGAAADPSQRQITSFFSPADGKAITTEKLQGPVLPANVQSNLLSVGMRIRKSVPEGYKTAGTSAFKLWTDDRPAKAVPASSTSNKSSGRELLPFCGINKIGGFDTQPAWALGEDEVPTTDDMPGLTFSQETIDDEAAEPSRKRLFEDGEEIIERESLAPMGGHNARVLAVPRSRTKKAAPVMDMGQENAAMGDDFEDCDFLVYDGERQMDITG